MVVTLEEAKLYLRVDGDEEDMLITHFILTTQELCEGILRYPLSEIEGIPETIKQAILYGVGCFYEQREVIDINEVTEVMKSLLSAHRKEGWTDGYMAVPLEEAKLYLRVDGDEENMLITHFILASQELCEGILRYPLSDIGGIPETIKQAILYGTGCFYEQRELVNTKEVTEIMRNLLFAYRKESW